MEGDPKFDASQDLPNFPYARYAELVGLMDTHRSTGTAGRCRALSADRPVVLEVYADPDVPPLPPHITFKQAKAYTSAILQTE